MAELGDCISAGVGLYDKTSFFLSIMVESERFRCNERLSMIGKSLKLVNPVSWCFSVTKNSDIHCLYHYLITLKICQPGSLVFQFQSSYFTSISLSISQTSRLCNWLGMKPLVHGGSVSRNPVGRFCNRLVEVIH